MTECISAARSVISRPACKARCDSPTATRPLNRASSTVRLGRLVIGELLQTVLAAKWDGSAFGENPNSGATAFGQDGVTSIANRVDVQDCEMPADDIDRTLRSRRIAFRFRRAAVKRGLGIARRAGDLGGVVNDVLNETDRVLQDVADQI